MKYHNLIWFQNRRGKVIYRLPIKTTKGHRCCTMCEGTEVKIYPPKKNFPDHAQYLLDSQNELGIEYFDRPVR